MKTYKLFIFLFLTILISSCELALGERLDVFGPVVEFVSPVPRKAVPATFDLQGRVSDTTGISSVLITAQLNTVDFPKQWRYNGVWEISEDYGISWQDMDPAQSEWIGSNKNGFFKIPIDMEVGGNTGSGEYLFILQAWDTARFSDDNSYKTRVFIVDTEKPSIDIAKPNLYGRLYKSGGSEKAPFTGPAGTELTELNTLHGFPDNSGAWKDPAMIGKFMTQEFDLQWQIEDDHDIWSIELRFYEHNIASTIDESESTLPPSGYLFRYYQNLPPPPSNPQPENYPKPNGRLTVPALDSSPIGTFASGSGEYELVTQVTEKKTITIVGLCMDAAGNVSEEKLLGHFIYWPKADYPWITFADGLADPSDYNTIVGSDRKEYLDSRVFMIYPGRNIKSLAFHAQGVREVRYSLYEYVINGSNYSIDYNTPLDLSYLETLNGIGGNYEYVDASRKQVRIRNIPQGAGNVYSTVFSWELKPPSYSKYYVVRATAYSIHGKESGNNDALFRVQDISFPAFREPAPSASDPLFRHLPATAAGNGLPAKQNDTLRISGTLTDATDISSLTMVWINPQSRDFSAMAQLEYFRDSDYNGWTQAKTFTKGSSGPESAIAGVANYPFDPEYPNRLWNLNFTPAGRDSDDRAIFSYYIDIPISQLNIGVGQQPLISQMFLLRAENPDKRCTIITYAPQGDTLVPTIDIQDVRIQRGSSIIETCVPGEYKEVPQFENGDRIIIRGNWREDSTANLSLVSWLYNNMNFSINGNPLINGTGQTTVVMTPASGNATSGTFTVTAVLGTGASQIRAENMKDSLTVAASVRDSGGNPSEHSASWLIKSDVLRFLRISSESEDLAYNAGKEIRIFLEFSKPVRLSDSVNLSTNRPALVLNSSGGRALYDDGQNVESTRQYFTYTVANGHNTTASLDITNLATGTSGANVGANAASWGLTTYPFTFQNKGEGSTVEEMRITMGAAHELVNGSYPPPTIDAIGNSLGYARAPTGSANIRSLAANKTITVDTVAPYVTSLSATPRGWLKLSSGEIFIQVKFNKNVTIGSGANIPYLILGTGNASEAQRRTRTSDVRVSGDTITFTYEIKPGDSSNGNALVIENYGGSISDIPGTALAANGFSSLSQANRTLTGVYIDTAAPLAPTLTVNNGTNINAITATVNGTAVSGTSAGVGLAEWTPGTSPGAANIFDLGTVYNDNLRLQVTANSTAPDTDFFRLEYSINYGKDWTNFGASGNQITLNTVGTYQIIARQTDRAGNVSQWSKPVTFIWDKGNIVSSINSTAPNNTHTYNTNRQDSILITVNFRKNINVTGTPSITLNATNALNNPITVSGTGGNNVGSLTFTYLVQQGDNTPGTDYLAVTSMNISATDSSGVNLSPTQLGVPAAGSGIRLQDLKQITVKTGTMSVASSAISSSTVNTDGTVNATLTVQFTGNIGNIVKGSGEIKIIQSQTGYRLPAVLTEAQRNRYRDRAPVTPADFDSRYTRGVNGANNDGSPDTTGKYILNYALDPADFNTFANNFREAESITLNVNSSAVSVSGNTLTVQFTGSNALQVPGANYIVTFDAAFVRDSLDNQITSNYTSGSLSVGGVARPFIRIDKPVETITVGTGNATTPRYVAAQPFRTKVKMDSRTPGAVIRYAQNDSTTNVTAENWYGTGWAANTTTSTATTAAYLRPGDNANLPAAPTAPANRNGGLEYSGELTVGTDNEYQGYIWRARAVAFPETGNGAGSTTSEEVAYRTVLTYVVQQMAAGNAASEQLIGSGMQVWVRGGDAVSRSTTPGFPLTWEDDWSALAADSSKRAGIRLMTCTETSGGNFNNSTWKWVTWEANVDIYFDIILGNDVSGPTGAELQRYGPRQWAYQRAGWTSFKECFRILPGKHRWVNTYYPRNLISYNTQTNLYTIVGGAQTGPSSVNGKGEINFSNTWSSRPTTP